MATSITLPTWAQGQADNEWREIAGSSMAASPPSVDPGRSSSGLNSIGDNWVGYSIDTRVNRVWSPANGGHDDTHENGVRYLDLMMASPKWIEVLPSNSAAEFDIGNNAARYSNGRPASIHSYYCQVFIEARNRAMRFGAPAVAQSGNSFNAVEGFDCNAPIGTNGWDAAGTWPAFPGSMDPALATCKVANEDVIVIQHNYTTYKWIQATNTWTQFPGWPPVSFTEAASAYDSLRDRVFLLRNVGQYTGTYTLNPNTGEYTQVVLTGPAKDILTDAGAAFGMVYVPAVDKYFVRLGVVGSAVYAIDPATWNATLASTTGGTTIPKPRHANESGLGNQHVYKKFLYTPTLGGIVYIPSYASNAWFLKLGEGSGGSNGGGSGGGNPPPTGQSVFKTITKAPDDFYSPTPSDPGGDYVQLGLHGSSGGAYDQGQNWNVTHDAGTLTDLNWEFNVMKPYGNNNLIVRPTDRHVRASGTGYKESYWLGWNMVNSPSSPVGLYTEELLDSMMAWFDVTYPNANKKVRPLTGSSMGGWGVSSYGLRRPHMFSSIYAGMPRLRYCREAPNDEVSIPCWGTESNEIYPVNNSPAVIGQPGVSIAQHLDMVAYVSNPANKIPFYFWALGRNDGYAPFRDSIAMVQAMRATNRGFAFAWNDGDHAQAPGWIQDAYTFDMFELGRGYPLLTNCSADQDPAIDLTGGINVGFKWRNIVETANTWSCELTNISGPVTVTVKPTNSTIYTGNATAKTVTIPQGQWVSVSFSESSSMPFSLNTSDPLFSKLTALVCVDPTTNTIKELVADRAITTSGTVLLPNSSTPSSITPYGPSFRTQSSGPYSPSLAKLATDILSPDTQNTSVFYVINKRITSTGGLAGGLYWDGAGLGAYVSIVGPVASPVSNASHSFCVTRTGASEPVAKLYVDGVVDAAYTNGTSVGYGPLYFGTFGGISGQSSADIDYVFCCLFQNTILTPAEITRLHASLTGNGAFALLAGAAVAPTLTGAIVTTAVTQTSYTKSWPTGGTGTTGYDSSLDGGATYTNMGNVTSRSVTGRTAGSTDQLRVRAYDKDGLKSTPVLTGSVTLVAVVAPSLIGSITITGNTTGNSFTMSWPAATGDVVSYEYSIDNGASYQNAGNVLTKLITGGAPSATWQVKVRAVGSTGLKSTPPLATSVTFPAGMPRPTLTGSITVTNLTSTSYTLTWPAATTSTGTKNYKYSLNEGASFTSVGNVLTVNVSGRTPSTTDLVQVQVFDDSTLGSLPALAVSVNLAASGGGGGSGGTVLTPFPLKNNAEIAQINDGGWVVTAYRASSGAVITTKTGQSTNATGLMSFNDVLITAGVAYYLSGIHPATNRVFITNSITAV